MNPADERAEALLFPTMLKSNVDYLRNQFAQVSTIVDPAQQMFLQQARAAVEANYGLDAELRRQQILMQNLGTGYASQSSILPLQDIEDFQAASPLMQKYIMACPEVHAMYTAQQIEGYYQSYVDPCVDLPLWTNPYYQQVANGLVMEDGRCSIIVDEEVPELSAAERMAVLTAWENAALHLQGQYDPTSVSNQEI